MSAARSGVEVVEHGGVKYAEIIKAARKCSFNA